jgi:hypothetical protein
MSVFPQMVQESISLFMFMLQIKDKEETPEDLKSIIDL